MNNDWEDILWEAEFEPGKVYQARVVYVDGYQEVAEFLYLGPKVNNETVNGYESLIIPEFQALTYSTHYGKAKYLEVMAVD